MPVSDKQLAANRANAARSTGPRTPESKARYSQKARTHGFIASSFVVRLEELNEIARLKHDLLTVYQPVNSQELIALEHMALAQHKMFRAARFGSGIFTNCLDTALNDNGTPFRPMHPDLVGDGDIEITRAQNRNALAEGFHRMARQSNSFSLFLRYKAQTELLYHRAMEEYDRIRALRPELRNEPISEVEPEENTPDPTPPEEPISNPQSNPASGEAPSVSEGSPLRAIFLKPRVRSNQHNRRRPYLREVLYLIQFSSTTAVPVPQLRPGIIQGVKARVFVSLKRTVLDPQGQTVRSALTGLGFQSVSEVRQGKFFDIALSPDITREQAHQEIDTLARDVLTNPVIEEYQVEISE
jgi:phosphoribosylformylglycinamidine synthase PurS subunit